MKIIMCLSTAYTGDDAYKPDIYGARISVERKITKQVNYIVCVC